MNGDQRYRLESLAVPESLEDLHVLLEQVGREHPEVAPADLMMFETAVVEIAGNVIEHGRPEGRVSFIFELAVLPDRLECLLTDTSARPVPDLDDRTMPQSDEDEDGRGIALAQMALDRIDLEHVDGVNRWTLVRNRH